MSLLQTFYHEAQAAYDQLVAWRRDFHRHPELGYQETRTAGIVADHLRELGLEVSTGIGKTGVVAVIDGELMDEAAAEDAPTVMLRFDMDALPIHEQTGLDFASQSPGVMHACGHDGHTAIGMGVAQLLVKHRKQLPGRVKLVFQPAEEGLGGAAAMVADGVMDAPTPRAAFGLHLWSRLPLNQVVVQAGPLWANAGAFELEVKGHGGHGAMPHETVDATLVAAQIVVAWQSIVARNIDPAQTAVLTVGTFASGNAFNVISGSAKLTGTIRSFDPATETLLKQRMQEVADGVCAAFGASCTLRHIISIPAVINAPEGAALMRGVAREVVGDNLIAEITPMMVGEDVSEFLLRAPGCFVLVGAGKPEDPNPSPHHNPTFDFDERMLPTGVALMAGAAAQYLAHQRAQDSRAPHAID
jgi:amidohydrolase